MLLLITLLNRYPGIRLESLASGNKEIKPEPENDEKILKVASIRDYLANSKAALI